jgi:hypothetical protein
MKRNTSGQVIGAQMVTAADGTPFTGTVDVLITGDDGSQTAGSVNSGEATHKGNGYHSYAPSQAETNFDHVAFTFVGTGAVPVTVQAYTSFPQTGDALAAVGALENLSASGAQAAAAAALVAHGAPTNTDLLARTLASADYATATQASTIAGRLPTTLINGRMAADMRGINGKAVTGDGSAGDKWGPTP